MIHRGKFELQFPKHKNPLVATYALDSATVVLNLNVAKYHEDMDEVASGGIPHFQRQIVCCCYHCAVVAIPCNHGNLQLCHFVF